jgi:hypothetical protein
MQRHERAPKAKPTGQLNPGDDAAPGTLGMGEAICPECRGSGRARAGDCANYGGTGRVVEGVGGG